MWKYRFLTLNVYCIIYHIFQITFNYFEKLYNCSESVTSSQHLHVTYVLLMEYVFCSCLTSCECEVNQKIKLICVFLTFVLLHLFLFQREFFNHYRRSLWMQMMMILLRHWGIHLVLHLHVLITLLWKVYVTIKNPCMIKRNFGGYLLFLVLKSCVMPSLVHRWSHFKSSYREDRAFSSFWLLQHEW